MKILIYHMMKILKPNVISVKEYFTQTAWKSVIEAMILYVIFVPKGPCRNYPWSKLQRFYQMIQL